MSTCGFTTRVVHSDRRQSIEYGALHKPVRTSTPFGYADSGELARVFQGEQAGFTYGIGDIEDLLADFDQALANRAARRQQ